MPNVLALKLLLTPFFIGCVTLVGRRWGPLIGGLLLGIPMTSGPVSLFLALQYSKEFAAHAAIGTIAGQVSICVFCLVYARISQTRKWPISVLLAVLAFTLTTVIWNIFPLTLIPAALILLIVIAVIATLITPQREAIQRVKPPVWDIPARMLFATGLVLVVTSIAPILGPQLSGLLTPFPVFTSVISAFTHHQQGAQAVQRMLRANVIASVAFGAFFVIVAVALPILTIPEAYALALLVTLVIDGVLMVFSQRAVR